MIDSQKLQMVVDEVVIEGKVYKNVTILTEIHTVMIEVPGNTYVRGKKKLTSKLIIPKLPKKEKK